MAKIIQFKKPKEKSNKDDYALEDKFISTLDLEQIEMFATIMIKAEICCRAREEELLEKIADLEEQLEDKKE